MPRIQKTKTVKIALFVLKLYLAFLLSILVIKLADIFNIISLK
jgi:hypothetical protein